VSTAFGWKRRADGLRRYRVIYVEVAKKNGKSTLAAGIALLLLFCDGEPGAEIYSAAADRDQASIVFDQAAAMCTRSKYLSKMCKVYRRHITVPNTGSFYRVLSSDSKTKHGLNPHGILFDELHVQDDRELWDTLQSGRAARRQPLTFTITTSGYDRKTLCGEMHDKAVAVRDGKAEDDTFLPVLYIKEPKDDWEDRSVWEKANPSLGITLKQDYLEQGYRDAKESPGYQNAFRRLHLCEWVTQETRWIDDEKWDLCAGEVDWQDMAERLIGKPCFAGLDLSTVTDLSALALVFDATIVHGDAGYPKDAEKELGSLVGLPPGWEYGDEIPAYDILCWFWCPDEGIIRRARKDRVPYDVWRDDGALISTEGDAVDHGAIRKKLQDLGKDYLIQEVAVDAWNAHKLITELEQDDGFIVSRVSQGFGYMTAPTKELDALYRRRQIRHGGHPALAWCAHNVSLDMDAYDNWKPSKKKSRERIDGMVALVMGLSRAIVSRDAGSTAPMIEVI